MEVSGRRVAGSEELLHTCDTCMDRRSVTRAAYGYCIECRVYLCEGCFDVHRDPPPCRNHSLLEGKQTPKERLPPVDMCETHTDEKINYFCKGHSTIACQKCVILQHRQCADVCDVGLLTVSSDSTADQRYKDLSHKIKTLESRMKTTRQATIQNLTKIDLNKKQAKVDIKQFCKRMHDYLYIIEKAMDVEVDQISEEDNKHMDTIQQECESVSADLKVANTMLETNHNIKRKGQKFIAMEKVSMAMQMLDDKLATLNNDNNVTDYKFEPHNLLQDVMNGVKKVGRLVISGGCKRFLSKPDVKAEPQWGLDTVTVQLEEDINIGTRSDKTTCWITGSSMMEGDVILAVSDFGNKSVKLVDVVDKKVLSYAILPDRPWDITWTQPDQLAVTLPDPHKIQFLSITMGTSVSPKRQMSVSGRCQGIACNNDRLFISFNSPAQVQIISMSGTILNTIREMPAGQVQFSSLYYITVSRDGSLMYLSDCSTELIHCLDMAGRLKGTYRNLFLTSPNGVCCAEDGSVIVCGGHSHNVHVTSSECDVGRVMVEESCVMKTPYSVAYCSVLSSLYVGSNNSGKLTVFKLK